MLITSFYHSNRKLLWLVLLTILLSACNIYVWIYEIRICKNFTFRYYHASYSELYYPQEMRGIIGFHIPKRDQVVIELSPPPADTGTWKIITDGISSYEVVGKYPKINLLNRLHTYKIVEKNSNTSQWSFTVKIDYAPRELYAKANNPTPDNYHIVYSTIPIGEYTKYPIHAFADNSSFEDDAIKVRQILKEKVNIQHNDSTKVKIEKLGIFLLNKLDDKRGIPSGEMDLSSPFTQYQYALSGKSGIWCSNFAAIYPFFANNAGIPTRVVSVGGRVDGVNISGHAFAESFIKETGQWAFVDLTSKKLFVTNSRGDFLNTLDIFHLNQMKVFGGVNASIFKDGKVSLVPYSDVNSSEEYYFSRDATFIFSKKKVNFIVLPRKIEQAFKMVADPDLAYSMRNSNTNYYITVSLFYAELVVLLIWLLVLMNLLISRRISGANKTFRFMPRL